MGKPVLIQTHEAMQESCAAARRCNDIDRRTDNLRMEPTEEDDVKQVSELYEGPEKAIQQKTDPNATEMYRPSLPG
jgi:hypothetical protein